MKDLSESIAMWDNAIEREYGHGEVTAQVLDAARRWDAFTEHPVSVIRAGVESGTIEGEVVWWCAASQTQHPFDACEDSAGPDCGWRLMIKEDQ